MCVCVRTSSCFAAPRYRQGGVLCQRKYACVSGSTRPRWESFSAITAGQGVGRRTELNQDRVLGGVYNNIIPYPSIRNTPSFEGFTNWARWNEPRRSTSFYPRLSCMIPNVLRQLNNVYSERSVFCCECACRAMVLPIDLACC